MAVEAKTRRKSNKGRNKSEIAFLDAAEFMFGENGYSGTTMRSIAEKANANLGAIHYYFGSKEALLKKVLERYMVPAHAELMKKLRLCVPASDEVAPDFYILLKAYIEPIFSIHKDHPQFDKMALRILNDPAPQVQKLFLQYFDEPASLFVGLLRKCNLQLSNKEFYWRLHCVMASITQLFTGPYQLLRFDERDQLNLSSYDEDEGVELVIKSLHKIFMAPPELPTELNES